MTNPYSNTTAADIIRFYLDGKLEEATTAFFTLMDKAVDGPGQFQVACAIAEVTAQPIRDARCCNSALLTVNPLLTALTEGGDEKDKAYLWAARFYTAVVNEDTDTATALWNALDEPVKPVVAVIAISAPLYNAPTLPHRH
ncbi:hypothetical protein [Streptomyces sp. NPDC056308]|uniref:hypothetical protein n=1 Tax=Streptomyces sp. NPDC056308 TaxID=3345780 RepID=UPI0035D82EF1